ncbi:MAG: hypothetical protein HKN70_00510, partial [Gammaproteobacteria bacterium]|nr:hypothetical protein [Gammaproteobacteria bacterium]
MAIRGLTPYLVKGLTSERLERLRELPTRWQNRWSSTPPVLNFFHQFDDPYSYLALEATSELAARYDIELNLELVRDEELPPARQESWVRYRQHDAKRLAAAWRMSDLLGVDAPGSEEVEKCLRCCASIPHAQQADSLLRLSRALWNNKPQQLEQLWEQFGLSTVESAEQLVAKGNAKRHEMGHYQAGTWHIAGRWYWGLDRLQYLEADLARLGLARDETSVYSEYFTPRGLAGIQGKRLDVFFSFRSPYSYLAIERLQELKRCVGIEICLRPVMPMVQRNVPLSVEKRNYILRDAARIARRHQLPFGRVCDPLGPGIDNCMKLFYYASGKQQELDMVQHVMRGIWSQGEDVSKERVLRRLSKQVGLSWETACAHSDEAALREHLQKNHQQLDLLGLWGVPTFAVTDATNHLHSVYWGQDRLP